MHLQLKTPIPLETPKGDAQAFALISDEGRAGVEWITILKESGECWSFLNSDVHQASNNVVVGVLKPTPFTVLAMMNTCNH
ncbi:MAG: hypothetical protein ACOYNL_03115 [Rickettsiales bacterium]